MKQGMRRFFKDNHSPGQVNSSWVSIFTSWGNLIRFGIFCGLAVFAFRYLIEGIAASLTPDASVKLSANTLEISGFGRTRHYVVLLPASQRWVKTSIDLTQNQCADFSASGRVSLNIDGLLQSAQQGKLLLHGRWIEPAGQKDEKPDTRKALRIMPTARLGSVLALFSRSDPREQAHPSDMIDIGVEKQCVMGVGTLWLTVNDWVINHESLDTEKADEEIYVGGGYDEAPEGRRVPPSELRDRWKVIHSRKEPFFDDNIGEYLVEVEIRRNK